MRSGMRLRAIVTMLLSVPLAGCLRTPVVAGASPCSALLPSDWLAGVAAVDLPTSAKLPDGHDDARPWQEGFIGQTGQLQIANDRYSAAVGIVGRCEARDAAVVAKKR